MRLKRSYCQFEVELPCFVASLSRFERRGFRRVDAFLVVVANFQMAL